MSFMLLKWVQDNEYSRSYESKIFGIRDSILHYAFVEKGEMDPDSIIKLICDFNKINESMRCLGIYKEKSKKNWKVNGKRLIFICKIDKLVEDQEKLLLRLNLEVENLTNDEYNSGQESTFNELESLDMDEQIKPTMFQLMAEEEGKSESLFRHKLKKDELRL